MVRLSSLVQENAVYLDLDALSPSDALAEMVRRLVQAGIVEEADRAALHRVLLDRESIGATAVGHGVALPHATFDKLPRHLMALARLRRPIDYAGPDDRPVDLIFLLLGPQRVAADHLQILSKITRLIKDEQFDQELRRAATPAAVLAALRATEDRHR